jgi:G3E family GTPase
MPAKALARARGMSFLGVCGFGDTGLRSLSQIAGSDVVILNKVDIASHQQQAEMEDIIRRINPSATIHPTTQAQVDLDSILNLRAYDSRPIDPSTLSKTSHEHNHDANEDCHCVNHYEVRGISSLSINCPPLDQTRLLRLDEWIRTILWENRLPSASNDALQPEILRCKGIFSVNGQQHVLQGVRSIYDIQPIAGTAPSTGKLVFIGRRLNEEDVRSSLSAVLWG